MIVDKDNEVFELPDGRKLGYAVYGDPEGQPVLSFHGIPGSRLQRVPNLMFLQSLSICLYSIDRPGIGLSSAKEDRSVLDWSYDVENFCLGLNIDQFSVVGISGGAPYALACAFRLYRSIRHVALISGLAPIDVPSNLKELDPRLKFIFKIADRHPKLLSGYLSIVYRFFKNKPGDAFNFFMSHLPESDQRIFDSPEIIQMFKTDIAEAFRQGSDGVVNELTTLLRPWGFNVSEIKLPIHIWHGTADSIVPFHLFHYMTRNVHSVIPHVIDNGGHFFVVDYSPEIFAQII
ncbi:alpha/beta hydrolase [candidate division KSB1 bacterium]|nr:alpha/beta hydrolase [candidate division KSB1 bacterium]